MTETTLQDRWDAMASLHQNAEAMVADGVMEGFAKTVDAAFAPYADVEAIIVTALPVGTPLSRAIAGGDRGWRVGHGWLSAEGATSSSPSFLSGFVRRLAAIPPVKGEKPRVGDPKLVERTLAAGRAM